VSPSLNPEIQFVLCPGRYPSDRFRSIYDNIYSCWQEVWAQTFLELDGNAHLKSDAFTRQDAVTAILVNNQCVAMTLIRYADATSPTFATDSYFQNWNTQHLERLTSRGPQILVCSHFTIHPTARKLGLGFSMKDYLMGFCTQFLLSSNFDAMTGAMRKNRKVHDLAYDWGAAPVGIDVPSGHGDFVDLVAFYKDEVTKARKHPIVPHLQDLWSNLLFIPQQLPSAIKEFSNAEHMVSAVRAA